MANHSAAISDHRAIRILLRTSLQLLLSAFFLSGCGFITDPGMRKVAEMDGKVIRAGDLMRTIRNMTDEQRPLIQNKGDLRRALDKHIDDTIKDDLAEQLLEGGKIHLNMELAKSRYISRNPQYREMLQPDVNRELMEQNMNFRPGDLEALMYAIELAIEEEANILLRGPALAFVRNEAHSQGALTITPAELRLEHDMRGGEMRHFETITFKAIRFPVTVDGAS
ncbi:MAG: hypothetical protein QGG73_03915, partial [Candidatus Hydrogenedentes bacterium]|nr:hypothetical protein [Candidatus Hydrogenedentota bacterium]